MFANPRIIPTLALAWLLYSAGRRLASARARPALIALSALLCLPGASFALYYLHALREPAWYVEWRSLPSVEMLSAFWGLLAGLLEPGPALAARLPSLRTLLGGRPAWRLALLLAAVPFIKPILLPVGFAHRLTDTWDHGVCKQSTMATCGPCSLATVLRTFGLERSEEQIARAAYSSATGTESWYLLRYARANGLRFRVRSGASIADLAAPAILGVKIGSAGHFVVYLGKDRGNYVIGDPLSGRSVITERDFARLVDFTGMALEFSKGR